MVVGKLLRLCGHGEHDDASYVAPDLKDSKLGRDCLEIGIQQVVKKGLATSNEIDLWKKEAAEEVQQAVANAQTDPGPDPYQDDWQAFSSKGIKS
jgi:pyruvate dehydrogenase E1 component alpha subunit/2-oxoisovalerate dehydrogenase E1 component alpha subunit